MTESSESASKAMEKMEIDDAKDQEENPKIEDEEDSDTSTTDDDDDDKGVSPNEAEDLLAKAISLKELGNNHFKKNELDQAARSYRKGYNTLKKLNKNNSGDDQVKALLSVLQNNLSTVLFKQKRYKASAEMAGKVIDREDVSQTSDGGQRKVKALYRRAVALRQMGEWDRARVDLKLAIQTDPSNAACKKEFAALKKDIEKTKQTQKQALAKAFSKDSSLLYDDKEAAEKRKLEEERRKKKEEQELYKKRKQEWEDECVHRMARDEPAISFDEWEKQRKEEEEKKKKEEEKKRKEEEKKRKESLRKQREAARKSSSSGDESSDDEELTEQELAMMRGYKKTKDGRTTSYFTRELSEEEKKVYDIAPKRLGEVSNTPTRLENNADQKERSSLSAWNKAGTWEEKDTSQWCTAQLRKRLEGTSVVPLGDDSTSLEAEIVSIEEVKGHASVAMAAGKKRYIFEYESSLKYEIKSCDDEKTIASGTVRLPDICSTHHDEVEVAFDAWNKRPANADIESRALEARQRLAAQLRDHVQAWVEDFNAHY